jgi:hypothetical protein
MRTLMMTSQQLDAVVNGERVAITDPSDGAEFMVSEFLVQHAMDTLLAGGEVVVLPRRVEDSLMEQIKVVVPSAAH